MRRYHLPMRGLRIAGLIAIMALGLFGVQASGLRMAPQPHPTRIHYINVGQADSILLEFDKAAVMIDAGGGDPKTATPEEETHLVTYLEKFFQTRPDLNRTIHTIIISHPHIDHTMKLPDVVKTFTVKNLIDGGDDKGSGITPLRQSREFVSSHGGSYFAINDKDVNGDGFENAALKSIHDADQSVDIKLLSGSRGCTNANNSSLVVLVTYKAARLIFTGDAEDIGDPGDCSDEITELIDRYKGEGELKADVLKVDHHGSQNGSDSDWLGAIKPQISVISAGPIDAAHQKGKFNAFQFGHPRESAVAIIEAGTTGTRTPVTVTTMDAVKKQHENRRMSKAVYCTCWDGNIVIETTTDGRILPPKTNQ